MVRFSDKELKQLQKQIKQLILLQKDEFTVYQLTNEFFSNRSEPTKREWHRYHRHIQTAVRELSAKGVISKGKKVESNAPQKKRLFKVLKKSGDKDANK